MNAILLRERLAQQSRQDARADDFEEGLDDGREDCHVVPPTPREIHERCAEIQREWTPRERLKRAGYRRDPSQWQPPIVHAGDLEIPS